MRFNDLYAAYETELQNAFLQLGSETIGSGVYNGMEASEAGSLNKTPDNQYSWWDSPDPDSVFVNSQGGSAPDGAVAFTETSIVVYGDDATGWSVEIPMLLLDDVVTVGQRRANGLLTPFPTGTPGGGVVDPCLVPSLRREWNADAAAADALRQMLDKAEEEDGFRDLAAREYGMVLCEFSNGTITPGPVVYLGLTFLDENGVPRTVLDENGVPQPYHPSVDVNFEGCPNGSTIIGTIHSHPSGQTPSGADRTWLPSINYERGGDGHGRLYIATQNPSGGTRINVYTEENVDDAVLSDVAGPEVNTAGLPCSN